MTDSNWALLHTRASVKREHRDAFDSWQRERHIPEILEARTCVYAAHYRAVEEGIPQIWRGTANIAANYFARSVDDLLKLLASAELEAAVKDGILWFGKFNELDGAEFTGNIYEPLHSIGDAAGATNTLAMQRFEVRPDDLETFDGWLHDYASLLADAPGISRIRSYRAVRVGSPLPYYYSLGNRAVLVDAAEMNDLVGVDLLSVVSKSQKFDTQLEYVRREMFKCVFALPDVSTG